MKKKVSQIFLSFLLILGISGCGKPEPPVRIAKIGTVILGERSAYSRVEKRTLYGKWCGREVLLEVYIAPLSKIVWKTDIILRQTDKQEVTRLLDEAWNIQIVPNQQKYDLAQTSIEITPEYGHGPDAVRISVTDKAAAAKFAIENADPQTAESRKISRCQEDIAVIEEALEHYRTDMEKYPRVLAELTENILMRTKWNGPYIEKIPRDPWDAEYI